MDKVTAIDKIKKCLALSRSAEAHEAAAALRQAQKLMAEYQVNDTDIALADISHVARPARTSAVPRWESTLARLVADSFGCDLVILRNQVWIGSAIRIKADIAFIGMVCAPEIAGYAWDVLSRQCARDRTAHIAAQNKRIKATTKTARGDVFAIGWVVGIRDKLERFAQPEKSTLLIEQYTARNWPNSQKHTAADRSKNRHITNNDHYLGFIAGERAKLDQGIQAPPAQGLLS
jgi:Protein of unknown function (DUF2786)